jgi:hypothetical protein
LRIREPIFEQASHERRRVACPYADELLAQARQHGRVRQEQPAFRSGLQTPLPEFAVEEAEIASALRAIDPGSFWRSHTSGVGFERPRRALVPRISLSGPEASAKQHFSSTTTILGARSGLLNLLGVCFCSSERPK